jgi:hypothetical protein
METAVARAGRALFKCPLQLRHFLLGHFHYWSLNTRMHKYVYFGNFNLTFQCTNLCTSAASTLLFSAHICVLRPLQPYFSVHIYVYFGSFNLTFQCTYMCTSAASTLLFSAHICVLGQLQPYFYVHIFV